jgi:hypothetical protein
MVMAGGEAMSVSAYLAVLALIAMVVFYALEERLQLAPLGFSAAALVALSLFALGRWPFGVVAVGFAAAALRRWYVERGREHRV